MVNSKPQKITGADIIVPGQVEVLNKEMLFTGLHFFEIHNLSCAPFRNYFIFGYIKSPKNEKKTTYFICFCSCCKSGTCPADQPWF